MTLSDIPAYTELPFLGVILPTITISPEDRAHFGAKEGCSNVEFLTQLCRVGFKEKIVPKIPKERHKEYGERVKLEIDTIESLGFTNYILMVWDICRFADKQGIPRGPGRGSVGSSLVSYLVHITELDPIEAKLFFSRFLSKARAKSTVVNGIRYIDGSLVPDIDCDFSYYRRGEVIDYVNQRYPGQTSKLLTTTTFTSKILIKDVMKVYGGATEQEANDVSDLIEKEFGVPQDIEDALSDDPNKANERFKEWAKDHQDVCDIAMSLSGLNRAEGQHASAVLIAHKPIRELMPLQLATADGEKVLVSGYDMYSAQEITIKMDLLGLRTLDVIDETCRLLGIRRENIDVHHLSIYAYLQDFRHRYGIFQLETFAQGNAAAKVKPKNFEQLTAVLAIARPTAFPFLNQFCDYLHNGVYKSIHPLIDDILKPTGGVTLYQEQYLAMLVKIGMTPEEAENARRVLGKKKKEEVPAVVAQINEICKRNRHPAEIVDLLVKIAEDSAGYGFNLSHAASYAMLTAYTIFLKVNHPLQFYFALLQMARHEADSHEVLQFIEKEMRVNGFTLLPPHFIKSEMGFKIEDDKSIRFALNLIRGISEKNMERMQAFLDKTRGTSLNKLEVFQALKNAKLNIGIGSALVQAGCMDGYDSYLDKDSKPFRSRSRAVLEAQTFNLLTDKEKSHLISIGSKPEVNWDVIAGLKHLSTLTNDKGKPLITPTRLGTLRKRYKPYADIYEMNSRNERLANFWYEKRVLGYSYSETLSSIFSEHIDGLKTTAELANLPPESHVKIIGFVSDPAKGKTKKGNDEFRFRLSDETGEIRVKAFNDRIAQIERQNGRLAEDGDIVIANLKKMEGDLYFAEGGLDGTVVGIQTCRIYLKLSDLKDDKTKEDKEPQLAQT